LGCGARGSGQEIAGWDIDVRPDGKGLPPGRGSVEQGQPIYDAKCASCHGTFGESNSYLQLAGGVGTLASDQPLRTTGSKLNYATTLWDYIRRAMPFGNPQSLGVDEVYALTAYVLNLNDIVPAGTVLDQESLPKLRMPNRDGFTTAHGFMRRDGRPDTANVACMHDCTAVVRVSSELPDYAYDSHGDLAEQRRDLGTIAGATASADGGADIARRAGCMACHEVAARIVGPAFREVAARYAAASPSSPRDLVSRLVAKVKAGGSGVWGTLPMPAQAHISDAQAESLVRWILGGAQ